MSCQSPGLSCCRPHPAQLPNMFPHPLPLPSELEYRRPGSYPDGVTLASSGPAWP